MTGKEAVYLIGYLGPRGTFGEEALRHYSKAKSARLLTYQSIPDLMQAIQQGEVHEGIVPIENSMEGSVNVTLDLLANGSTLTIRHEIVLPVRHNLLVRNGYKIEDVELIMSHPQALAQCREYLRQNFKGVPTAATRSTAEAAYMVSREARPMAAIATETAARIYKLRIVARDLQGSEDNFTRFVILGRPDQIVQEDPVKTSIAFALIGDRPGGLYDVLYEFASRDINLTKIESRPSKRGLGKYIFFIDMEGGITEDRVKDALEGIKHKTSYLKILGSYPVTEVKARKA